MDDIARERIVTAVSQSSASRRTVRPPESLIDLSVPAWRHVIHLAWPVLAQQLLILSVTLSDAFLAGHFQPVPPGERAIAASRYLMAIAYTAPSPSGIGVGNLVAADSSWAMGQQIMSRHVAYQAAQTTAHYLSWFITSYSILVSVGSAALVARMVGAGDWKAAIHVTNQSIVLAAIFGIAGSIAGLIGVDYLVRVLQLQGDAARFAAAYLRPLFWFLTLEIIEAAGIACLVGAGDTRTGFWILGGVAVLNLPMAWCLFHGIGSFGGYGFEGIALGTAISEALGGLAAVCVLTRGRAGLHLRLSLMVPDLHWIRRLLRISVPAGMDSLSLVLGQFWFLSIVNGLGDVAAGAHGIAIRWEALGYLSGAAFGTAAMTLVGQNLGAGNPRRAARSGWTAWLMGAGVMTTMGAIFYTLAPLMFKLFCPGPDQESIVLAGVPVLRLVAFAMPPLACCIVFTYALRGAGDTRVPMLITWLGFLGLRIPLAYLLTDGVQLPFVHIAGFGLGLIGAWIAMFVDIVARGACFVLRFTTGGWQRVEV
jgi:putative MATE family efflux protein